MHGQVKSPKPYLHFLPSYLIGPNQVSQPSRLSVLINCAHIVELFQGLNRINERKLRFIL